MELTLCRLFAHDVFALAYFQSLVKLLFLPSDPVGPLKAASDFQPTHGIRVRWSRNKIPVSSLKRVSLNLGSSINDILVGVASGALASFVNEKTERDESKST